MHQACRAITITLCTLVLAAPPSSKADPAADVEFEALAKLPLELRAPSLRPLASSHALVAGSASLGEVRGGLFGFERRLRFADLGDAAFAPSQLLGDFVAARSSAVELVFGRVDSLGAFDQLLDLRRQPRLFLLHRW